MQKKVQVVYYSTIKTLQQSFNDSKEKINKKRYTATFFGNLSVGYVTYWSFWKMQLWSYSIQEDYS